MCEAIAVAYILLCKLNYGYHNRPVFVNNFQTEHFSAVNFAMSYDKNIGLFVVAKSPKLWKNC